MPQQSSAMEAAPAARPSVIRWPAEALWQAMAPTLPGLTVEVLPEVDSTNSELMRRARAGHVDPVLLVAEQQSAGRGRMGRSWASRAGDSLTFSLGLPLQPADWSGLSLAVGVAVAESLHVRVGLKWPNDLWLDGERKLGGILVETASLPGQRARYAIVGVGINIAPQPAQGLRTAPACVQELGLGLDAPGVLERVAAPLVDTLLAFVHYGFAPLQPRFARRDVLAGRSVDLSDGRSGTAHGVAEDGALLVMTPQGMQAVTSAEISVRPASQS